MRVPSIPHCRNVAKPSIQQFIDVFLLLKMALVSCMVDHFLALDSEFVQEGLYKDMIDVG